MTYEFMPPSVVIILHAYRVFFLKKNYKNSEEKFVRLGSSSLRPQDLIDRKKCTCSKAKMFSSPV